MLDLEISLARSEAPAVIDDSAATRRGDEAAFDRIEQLCRKLGITLTLQRRLVLEVMLTATDHPCAFEIHRRISRDRPVGIATVYRALNALTAAGILVRHVFSDDRARYEIADRASHPHLIDVETGKIVEVDDGGLMRLIKEEARRLGYSLVDYRLKIFAVGARR